MASHIAGIEFIISPSDSYNEKALKCKPSALIFGRGRAKKSIALQGSYNIGI